MITYRKLNPYKYQLTEDYIFDITLLPMFVLRSAGMKILMAFIEVDLDIDRKYTAQIIVSRGYAWDGPSGPTIDTPVVMRPSLEHDVSYQMMREGWLSQHYRETADKRLMENIKIDADVIYNRNKKAWYSGLVRKWDDFRAWYYCKGVKDFASSAAKPSKPEEIYTAP